MAVRRRWWVALLLMAGVMAGLGWRGSLWARDGRCEGLMGLRPVAVAVADAPGAAVQQAAARTGIAYRDLEGDLLIPLRGLVEPFVQGPLGIYWDEATATLSLLGPEDVLSVHFPEGEAVRERGILNGEAVSLRAVACGEQFYLSGSLLGDLLHLDLVAADDGQVWLAPR